MLGLVLPPVHVTLSRFSGENRAASLTDRLREACGPLPYVEVWLAHRLSRPSQPSHLITLEAWAWGLWSVNGVVGAACASRALLSAALGECTCVTMKVLKCLWWHRAYHWGAALLKDICSPIWCGSLSCLWGHKSFVSLTFQSTDSHPSIGVLDPRLLGGFWYDFETFVHSDLWMFYNVGDILFPPCKDYKLLK